MLWIAVVALAVQTTAAPQKTPDKITITGCVERADEMRGADTIGTTTDSLHFVLVSIPAEAVGTSGSTGAARPSMDKGYRLDAPVEKLNPHVGHKVEISGYVDQPASTSGEASAATGPMVKVESVKMLSETCGR